MEITWYGHSCFRLRGREGAVVTDPFDKSLGYALPTLKADIVTVSHPHPGHSYVKGVKGTPRCIAGPGEYEISGIFVTGIATFHDSKKGALHGRNTVYFIEMEDLTICHLGDLGHVPTQTQVEDWSSVDVLLIPVGGGTALNAGQASEVISLLEPGFVVPMHYRTPACQLKLDKVDKFLKEMGIKAPPPQESLKVTKSSLPEDTQVVILEYKQ